MRYLAFFASIGLAILSPLSYALLQNTIPWHVRAILSWILLAASIIVITFVADGG